MPKISTQLFATSMTEVYMPENIPRIQHRHLCKAAGWTRKWLYLFQSQALQCLSQFGADYMWFEILNPQFVSKPYLCVNLNFERNLRTSLCKKNTLVLNQSNATDTGDSNQDKNSMVSSSPALGLPQNTTWTQCCLESIAEPQLHHVTCHIKSRKDRRAICSFVAWRK